MESGSFWELHQSWWQVYQFGSVDLLWISYEELLSEPEKSISRVTKFIGLEPTTELTKGVLTASNFQAMKQTAAEENAKLEAEKANYDNFKPAAQIHSFLRNAIFFNEDENVSRCKKCLGYR